MTVDAPRHPGPGRNPASHTAALREAIRWRYQQDGHMKPGDMSLLARAAGVNVGLVTRARRQVEAELWPTPTP